MIYLKQGVKVNGLRVEALLALVIANEVYSENGYDCVLTEATGGKHGTASLHYTGNALDLRTRHITDKVVIESIAQTMRIRLGEQYDVVVEKDHIHVEYQPK